MATIVHQGPVKYCDDADQWQDVTLTLFSDASLTTLNSQTNQLKKHETRIFAVAAPAATYYSGCIVVSSDKNEVEFNERLVFYVKDAVERKKWIRIFNETRLKATYAGKHPHPLIKVQFSSGDGFKCILCSNEWGYTRYCCEYCHDYQICAECGPRLGSLPKLPFIRSQSHPHELTRDDLLERGKLRSRVTCSKCTRQLVDRHFTCSECPHYVECMDCACIGTETRAPIGAPMKLHTGLSDHVLKQTVPGTYSLQVAGQLCPQSMSVITSTSWDLSSIELAPVPHAYFEVTFNALHGDGTASVGVGNQIFVENAMLGLQQNSFGYFSSGSISHNSPDNAIEALPAYKSGDTIGAGILYNSFNIRRLFFTKNGVMLCVSFTKNSGVEFSVNMSGPFKFDVNSIPDYRGDKTNRLDQLPNEVVADCLAYVCESPQIALQLRKVSKKMSAAAKENVVWRHLFLKQWPQQNGKLKLKSWYNAYKRRSDAIAGRDQPLSLDDALQVSDTVHPIENCELEFQCPLMWERLKAGANDKEKFCEKCQKTVYEVRDQDTMAKYVELGRCVSFIVPKLYDDDYERRLGGEAPRQPRRIPTPPGASSGLFLTDDEEDMDEDMVLTTKPTLLTTPILTVTSITPIILTRDDSITASDRPQEKY